jgi:hypothetical protein
MVWTQKLGPDATPDEKLVFEALDDPRWSWRTLKGLSDSIKLDERKILHVLLAHPDLIRFSNSEKFGPIFQLVERHEPPEESFIDQALNYLSMGRRRIA